MPDPVTLYTEARDSAARFHIVLGRFDRAPSAPLAIEDAPLRFQSRLTGQAIGPSGFGIAYDREVTLVLSCAAVWCASPPEIGRDLLVAVRLDGKQAIVELHACPSNALPISDADLRKVIACHGSGQCAGR